MKLIKILILLCFGHIVNADPYKYEVRKIDSHIIHVVTLHPKDYEIKFIKAHNQVFGRETVKQIAERENADIAINGGFFEIGGAKDGMPSLNMIVDGRVFGLVNGARDNLILSENKLSIDLRAVSISARLNEQEIHIDKYNDFAQENDVVLYTDTFGSATLTNYKKRHEAAFDNNCKLIKLYDHGNIDIPQDGYVLSFPKSQDVQIFELKLTNNNPLLQKNQKFSMITGIPLLVVDGVINTKILDIESDFYRKPHARTAIGFRKNGEMVVVIAEYAYTKDLNDVTMEEVREVIKKNVSSITKKYNKLPADLTLNETKEIVKSTYASSNNSIGLTIIELANLMLELGCDSAINLDGGGSSSLWMQGKIVSQTVGDKDEGLGKMVERPVSDAIIFKKK